MSQFIQSCISIAVLAVLTGCSGQRNPVVVAAAGIARATSANEISSEEQATANVHVQGNVARLTTLCDGIETRFRNTAALKHKAAKVEALGLAVGHDIVSPAHKACIAFHAEAAGRADSAYRLFFDVAVLSLTERRFIALHYGVLEAILRLRASGHALAIQRAGSEMVTSLTCADLRREAPGQVQCR